MKGREVKRGMNSSEMMSNELRIGFRSAKERNSGRPSTLLVCKRNVMLGYRFFNADYQTYERSCLPWNLKGTC